MEGESGEEEGLSSVRATLTTPTNQSDPLLLGSKVTDECSTPVQTVATPTPSLPSVTGGVVSDSDDAPPTSSPHSSTHHTSPTPSHPHSSPPPPTSSPHSTPSTTSTPPSAHKRPKTWAAVVRKSGSGSQPVATPTSLKPPLSEVKGKGGGEDGETNSVSSESSENKPSVHLKSLGGTFVHYVTSTTPHSLYLLSVDQLEGVKVCHGPFCLTPRGLVNQGNWCYLHAVSLHMVPSLSAIF